VFGLTDETYGLVTTIHAPAGAAPANFYFYLTALNQFWWLLGCTAGALFGKALPFDTGGLDFAMTALFVVLLVEQTKSVRRFEPYAAAVLCAVLAYFLAGPANFILAATLLVCVTLLLLRRRIEGAHPKSAEERP